MPIYLLFVYHITEHSVITCNKYGQDIYDSYPFKFILHSTLFIYQVFFIKCER